MIKLFNNKSMDGYKFDGLVPFMDHVVEACSSVVVAMVTSHFTTNIRPIWSSLVLRIISTIELFYP
jgi:hypothetical protein